MDREQEEDVLRVTAQYMAELQAGHQPRLSDYLVRYPQYADAISEFVTYYHAVEAGLTEESPGESHTGTLPQLSDSSRMALERAWERIEAAQTDLGTTLLMTINKRGLSLSQLATEVGLSEDIVAKLIAVRPLIEATTLPQELLRRLAHVLRQPLSTLQTYFGYSSQLQAAETRAPYHTEAQTQSFREALEQSAQLSDEQKEYWREILMREGL
jgi:transcriptional regulator with XRE-family HTH domain